MFREMEQPDMHTYVALVKGLCDARRGEEGLSMLQRMKEIGWRNVGEADKLLEEMFDRGLMPCVVTCTAVVNAHCREGRMSDAVRVFEAMKLKGCEPYVWTYNATVQGFCNKGKVYVAYCRVYCLDCPIT
ncbi:hypothetical protein PR202_ga24614 [Eleusine coracana subsp. coracana]|uniref:Pentatricopeptide repeat-containing protein n=1 Tax=Eleusine coracana subsp. coracana TaxID=191504 RepID=A0AAV5D8T7_ELECO|nr:hypothetical protein PR202_ga24614 [Eleusine coracana subsp. coracana]